MAIRNELRDPWGALGDLMGLAATLCSVADTLCSAAGTVCSGADGGIGSAEAGALVWADEGGIGGRPWLSWGTTNGCGWHWSIG
jgi:hypothetical protein